MTDASTQLKRYTGGEVDLDTLLQDIDEIVAGDPSQGDTVAADVTRYQEQGYLSRTAAHTILEHLERTRLGPRPPAPNRSSAAGTDGATQAQPASTAHPSQGQPTRGASIDQEATERVEIGPGTVLNNRFVLEETIGGGGMGVVYRARDLRREEAQDREPHVACKVLGEAFKGHPDALTALQREAKKAQRLAHPNIVTVYDFDRDGETVYMTMELLDGEPLDNVMQRTRPNGLPLREALPIFKGMVEGLAYAHEQDIVHADVKPSNVFVNDRGAVKLLDFGIARAAKRPGQERTQTTVFDPGALSALTPAYASCEMIEGHSPDPRDDVYGLACIAYELLAGRHPFNRLPATQARDGKLCPTPIKGLKKRQQRALSHALAFDRERRTPNVRQFLTELEPSRQGVTSTASMIAALAGIVVIAGGALSMQAWLSSPTTKPAEPQAPAPITKPAVKNKVESLLAAAEAHQMIGRLVEPAGSNAADAYRRVLKLHPHDQRATQGLNEIRDHFLRAANRELDAGQAERAISLIEKGLQARPNDPELRDLKEQASDRLASR